MRKPFSYLCIPIIIGIIISHFFKPSLSAYFLIALVVTNLVLSGLSKKYAIIFLAFSFVLLGIYVYSIHIDNSSVLQGCNFDKIILELEIKNTGLDRERYVEYDADILKIIDGSRVIEVKERIRLELYKDGNTDFSLEPTDIISIKNPIFIESLDGDNLEAYKLYLRGKGIRAIFQGREKDIIRVDKFQSTNLFNLSFKIRRYLEDFFDQLLPSIEAGILKSIIFGNQGYLEDEILDLFSISGTAHIIAVSGLHVGVIVLILHKVFGFLGMGKKEILLITMIFLLLYSAIANFPVSIIRAVSMYYLYVIACFLHRRYDPINGLMLIAFLLLLYNPLTLFSISFQLSFSATLAILLFYPWINQSIKIKANYLQSLISVTVAAQLGTIPIMIFHFQQISLIAFVANIFIVPILVPLLMTAGISSLFSIFSMHWASRINLLTHVLLKYMHWMVRKLSNLSFASIEVVSISYYHIIFYYSLLFGAYHIFWSKRKELN